jgi:hypothetical protein
VSIVMHVDAEDSETWPAPILIASATLSSTKRYTLTEHAYDEMDEDNLDVLDIESAILTGQIDQVKWTPKTGPLLKE